MKNITLKELRLGVGTTPANKPLTKHNKFVSLGGFHSNADDVFQKRYSLVNEDDDEESEGEEMAEDILELRSRINGKYSLQETLNNVDKQLVNEIEIFDTAVDAVKAFGGKALKTAKDAGKSFLGGIPIVDVVFGSYRLAQLAESIRNFSDDVSTTLGREKGYFGDCLKSPVNSKDWDMLLSETAAMLKGNKSGQDELEDKFNKVLESLKDFIITMIEAYDTIVEALASGATGFTLALPMIAGGNVATGVGGFAARTLPFERVLFGGGGYIARGMKTILDLFRGDSDKSAEFEKAVEPGSINKMRSQLKDVEEKGGSVMTAFLFSPVETLARLHQFYNVVGDSSAAEFAFEKMVSENKNRSILFLLESVEKDSQKENFHEIDLEKYDEDIEEAITLAGGNIGGRIGPLGDEDRGSIYKKRKKAIEEQRERIAILQSYHQKTTSRLK